MAYPIEADADVSESVVVPGRRGPGSVRAVCLVSYCGPSQRVWFAFDVLHSRLSDSDIGFGGAGSTVRLGLLSAGARASIERVSAPTRGPIRAVSSADATASKGAETRLVGRRDGFYSRSRYRVSVAHDDISAR